MLSTALDFPNGKKVTDHYSILHRRPYVFAATTELDEITKQMVTLSLIGL